MNMSKESIEYKSIIMRCDRIEKDAFIDVSDKYTIVKYHSGMESVWAEIQKVSGQFEGYTDEDILEYFKKTFLQNSSEISERCIFLKDIAEGMYIGTCCAWFAEKDKKRVPVLHWLAVIPQYRNKGCARMLITETLKIFSQKYGNQGIYLHTQPSSYQAIKLYNDFGFNIAREDCYGHAVNEYAEAMEILERVMENKAFERLQESAVR